MDKPIEYEIGELLIQKGLTISTAESCTGGLLAGKIINYPGISSVFVEGAITYSNGAKIKRLGVKEETLEKYGAVSRETAEEMAYGIAKTACTEIGISTTGIAGPSGGTKEKPIGLVYIGLCIDGEVSSMKLNLIGNREEIRTSAVNSALLALKEKLI